MLFDLINAMNKTRFFDDYYDNAEMNSILIMNCDGRIIEVNKAFTNNFGYDTEDLKGQNFNILFTEENQERNIPKLELDTVMTKGQSHDENYIIDKNGNAIWCTGEAVLVADINGEKYIVKDILNLQARKQLDLFLTGTEDLLERIFKSSKDIPMMILDGSMKIQNVNAAFLELFEITDAPPTGSSLSYLKHPFWNNDAIRKDISKIIVTNQPVKRKEFLLKTQAGENKTIRMDSNIIHNQPSTGRRIFIILEEVTS
jgi:PAS domain S-box-containing protein